MTKETEEKWKGENLYKVLATCSNCKFCYAYSPEKLYCVFPIKEKLPVDNGIYPLLDLLPKIELAGTCDNWKSKKTS